MNIGGRPIGVINRFRPRTPFWLKVSIKSEDECWIYNGTENKTGYGIHCCNRKQIWAHRYSYMAVNADTLDIKTYVYHTCGVKLCVNPKHLRTRTQTEHVVHSVGKAKPQRQTYCKRGHKFTFENTRVNPSDGQRWCRTCLRARARKAYYREKYGLDNFYWPDTLKSSLKNV